LKIVYKVNAENKIAFNQCYTLLSISERQALKVRRVFYEL